ncbi:MAG: hypothetical protein C0407_03365 [Desulfobacca sp.]|nr:hypothetical protein [Desulfobacca sp.]
MDSERISDNRRVPYMEDPLHLLYCRELQILINGFLIKRKLEIRVAYLKFEGFGFGWGSLFGLPVDQILI